MDYFAAARAFVRAAELRSFSKAAQDLAVKVSTVSRQIGELERHLGELRTKIVLVRERRRTGGPFRRLAASRETSSRARAHSRRRSDHRGPPPCGA
jgi:hypothetical protein